jgi:transaldolase
MELFLDTGDVREITRWLSYGVIDGVTTNPSILLASGRYDVPEASREIAELLGERPLSVEVTSDEPEEMLAQAREFASWAPNIVVKVPVENSGGRPCLDVVHRLAGGGVRVNVTACLSFGQAMLAAKAGATFVSLFAGRISDEGHDPAHVIGLTTGWLERWKFRTKVIVGSIRAPINVQEAAVAGAHVVTVPPKLLQQLADHKYSRFTAAQFLADAAAAQTQLEAAAAARLLHTGSTGAA